MNGDEEKSDFIEKGDRNQTDDRKAIKLLEIENSTEKTAPKSICLIDFGDDEFNFALQIIKSD